MVLTALPVPLQAQLAIGQQDALAAAIPPLGAITVPDVNVLGLLDKTGPGADHPAWPQITKPGNQLRLQQLGKALFWDMQVGGDGIQSCASCHFHAGADNRKTNQISPGLKRAHGGQDPAMDFAADTDHDLLGPNETLTLADFQHLNQNDAEVGLPVSEAALIAANPDVNLADQANGMPGFAVGVAATGIAKAPASLDVNDVVSSQGVRLGSYIDITCFDAGNVQVDCDDPAAVTTHPVDTATLAENDPGFDGFTFPAPLDTVHTVRRVEPRNSPTAVNAVYNLRNFWDGRADPFFNGVNPLGFRDPGARVKTYDGESLGEEKLRIAFSSLASQAVGPIESDFEMVFGGRPHRDLGKKLLNSDVVPLAGQMVSCTDSLLGSLTDCATPGSTNRGLTTDYASLISAIFDERFWGNGAGADVCLNAVGALDPACPVDGYTLMEWNFSLFFGLAVQAYEATLTTEQTIVDLLVGGIATGTVVNTRGNRTTGPIDVAGLPLEGCITLATLGNNARAAADATNLCTQHYAQFIHPRATAGSEASAATAGVVAAGDPIGGCAAPVAQTTLVNGILSSPCNQATLPAARASLLAIDRGIGRFFAGATGCGICHFNPEFTGATVSALTGFGAAPLPPLPPGQVRRIAPELPMERMIAFDGAAAVYDSGFYNLGVRPTPEDLSLGDQIGGVPLAFTKLAELLQAGPALDPPFDPLYDQDKIAAIEAELAINAGTGLNELLIPISPADLSPRPFTLAVACGPGLVGNGNANGNGGVNGRAARDAGGANNNPAAQCAPNVLPNERLLRNGAFKAQGLRNVKFTGPYMHNGSKLNLRQVVEFYRTTGHFPTLNLHNLDAGLRIFALGAQDEAALVEMMETGLTDWRLAHEEGKFDHPEICVPNGHHPATGETILAGIPAVGSAGSGDPLATFEDIVRGDIDGHEHTLTEPCSVPGTNIGGLSVLEEQPPAQ
jgi:cytochrome c peroxidase